MGAPETNVVIADLVRERLGVRTLRIWCWDAEVAPALARAIAAAISEAGGDPASWRIDLIVKDVSVAELARLGYLDAALCGDKIAALNPPERDRLIDALSRLIATDGYAFATGLGERLRDRFTRDPRAPGLYRPTALTLDLSFL